MSLFGMIAVSVLCAAAAAGGLLWLKRYYADKIFPKAAMLTGVAERIDELPPCSMDNLAGVRGVIEGCKDEDFTEAFSRYEAETVALLRSRVAPEAYGHFHFRSVYGVPDADAFRKAFQPFAAAGAVILALTPLVWTLLAGSPGESAGKALATAFGISMLCAIWSAAVCALIAALDRRGRVRAVVALEALKASLRYALPTAGESTQAALLQDAVDRAGEAFAESADHIVRKIDSFAVDSIIPAALLAFDESITKHITPTFASIDATLASLSEAVSAKQEEGIRLLAAEFSEQLFGAIERQISEVTGNVEKVSSVLSAAADHFEASADQIRVGLAEDRETLKSVMELATQTTETQNHTAESIFTFSDYLAESRILVDALRAQSSQVMASIAELAEQSRAADETHAAQLGESREALTRSLIEVRAVLADNAALLAKYEGSLEQSLTAAAGTVQGAYDKSRVIMMEYMSKADESVRQYIDLSTERLEKQHAADADEYARRMEDGRAELAGALEAAKLAMAESSGALRAALAEASGAMSLGMAEAVEAAKQTMGESAAAMSGGMAEALEATRQALGESTGAAGRNVAEAVEAMRLTSAESAGTLSREMGGALEAIRLQQTESSAMYASYGQRLESSLAGAEEAIRRALDESRALLAESLEETGGVLKQHIDAGGSHMESVAKDLMAAVERQENTMNINLGKLVTSISGSLQKAMESNAETASRLARTTDSLANAGTEQYEKAAQAAAQLLENIVTEINKAMEGVGEAISGSIGQATADSADIVKRLAEQTSLLKEEYDTYFSRMDEQTRNSFDDLDFHMQNVSARFAEETQTVIVTLQESISGAMGLFEGNTATLLTNLDEQSRSIGLYAKELSYDISSLSTNLKEAVAEFSEHLHEGVVRTFDDFDEGLSEVSKRLANTVESIRDSVDNLPAAISGQGRGA